MADVKVNANINNPPCKIKDIVIFDVRNLEIYLDFLSNCSKGNLEHTLQLEQDFKKKSEIVKMLEQEMTEALIKIGALTYKQGEVENSIEKHAFHMLEIDEKLVKADSDIQELTKVKDLMLEKMDDINVLKEAKIKLEEDLEVSNKIKKIRN